MSKKQLIFKYDIVIGEMTIQLHKDAKILTIQLEDNEPKLWVMSPVDDAGELIGRQFLCIDTGDLIHQQDEEVFNYIGTYQSNNERRVMHLFEITIK